MKNVFEYMGWDYSVEDKCRHEKYNGLCPLEKHSTSAVHVCKDCCYCFYTYKTDRKFDGNDMVLASNKMRERGDFNEFVSFFRWKSNMNEPYKKGTTYYYDADYISFMIGDPANFFRLMEEALKKGVIGK